MLRYSLMLGCQVLGVHATRLASHGDMYLRLRLQKEDDEFPLWTYTSNKHATRYTRLALNP